MISKDKAEERVLALRKTLEAATKNSAQLPQDSSNLIEANKALVFIRGRGHKGSRGCEEEVKKQDCKLIINGGGDFHDADDSDSEEQEFDDFVGEMLSVKPI